MPEVKANPHILFIHTSWHCPAHFDPIRALFYSHGFQSSCPALPANGVDPPIIGLKEDAECIREELTNLIDLGNKDVLVVAHGYGGMVATEAVDARFGRQKRMAHGKKGGVVRLFYLCSFLPEVGQSLSRTVGAGVEDFLPPWVYVDEEANLCWALQPEVFIYQDLYKADQLKYSSMLRTAPLSTMRAAVSQTAYTLHPITYLICENNQALPPFVQRGMLDNIMEMGVEVDIETCQSGHSPYLSMPDKVLEIVVKIVSNL